jgi:DNA-binding transcriptional LysR family regulator
MDIRLLRYFVTVAEQRHFGKAADLLNMAQPPLSQQIRLLEDELAVKLFDRSSRPIELTAAGRTLLREARQILSQIKRAETLTRRAGKSEAGNFRIGITGSAALEFAAPVIAICNDRFPEVQLSLLELSSPAQMSALEKGSIQIGFVRPPVISEEISSRLVHQEPFLIALPERHPLAHTTGLRLRDLNGTPLVVFDSAEAPGFRELILHVCHASGYTPTSMQDGHQMTTMLCLVASGLGAALVPQSARQLALEGIVFKPVLEEAPMVDLYAIWLKNGHNPLVHDLLAAIDDLRSAAALVS